MAKTTAKYNFTMAIVAFFFWGGWSYYINTSEQNSGLLYGVVQGTISFLMTLIMVYIVTFIFNNIKNKSLRLFSPAFIICSVMTILLTTVHYLIDTPFILYTIAPSIAMAFVFCIITALKLNKSTQ
jgi:hypothetical protein